MNEFIEQFILESRELVEQASSALLALEKSPQDPECVAATFRAMHTLKGGAAIVDFFAMERAVHAVEDALSAVRSGRRALTAALIADCFACLDQVSRWLGRMEQSGELPAGAEEEAEQFIARMVAAGDPRQGEAEKSWFKALSRRSEGARSQARTVVRFTPPSASFFRGEDPLALVASMPGLLSMELALRDQPLALGELDPFECRLIVTAFGTAAAEEVSAHFDAHLGECEIRTLDLAAPSPDDTLAEAARRLLETQMSMLDAEPTATFVGRLASAGRVAANVLRHGRRAAAADHITLVTEQCLAAKEARPLREAIAHTLAPTVVTAVPLAAEAVEPSPTETVARSFRVAADRIDALVRLTGELMVAKNAIGYVLELANADANAMAGTLLRPYKDLDHLIGELQGAVLGIRVLPLRTVLQRLQRLVREISTSLDKPVALLIEGEETEADKAIIDMLFEPLLHIVRNAIDHGVETAAIRRERHKPAVATLRLRASREGGHVLVEVEDDGGGVDVERVRAVAKERGVASAAALDAMTEEQIIDLVFAAGFSTAARVTGLSGRGVGMDAVRTAVERVGGQVTIESRQGLGTTVKLLLPFSVMLTRVMTVEAGGQLFGIPLEAVIEVSSVPAADIVGVGAAQALVWRNRTLPIFELTGLLEAQPPRHEGGEATIVVAAIAGQVGGLRVDRLGERMEVMLKPLDGLLTGVPGVAGTTILGDGRVLLVLDLAELLQ